MREPWSWRLLHIGRKRASCWTSQQLSCIGDQLGNPLHLFQSSRTRPSLRTTAPTNWFQVLSLVDRQDWAHRAGPKTSSCDKLQSINLFYCGKNITNLKLSIPPKRLCTLWDTRTFHKSQGKAFPLPSVALVFPSTQCFAILSLQNIQAVFAASGNPRFLQWRTSWRTRVQSGLSTCKRISSERFQFLRCQVLWSINLTFVWVIWFLTWGPKGVMCSSIQRRMLGRRLRCTWWRRLFVCPTLIIAFTAWIAKNNFGFLFLNQLNPNSACIRRMQSVISVVFVLESCDVLHGC